MINNASRMGSVTIHNVNFFVTPGRDQSIPPMIPLEFMIANVRNNP